MESPPTAAVAVNKPAPPTAPVQNPTSAPAASSTRQQPEIHGNDAGGQKATKPPAVGAPAVSGSISGVGSASEAGPVTDLEKKLRRAERFGMRVMLSDEEKRNSRAERFGTGSTPNGSKNVGQLEEQKRKTRAERFGLKSLTVDDEEAKKKARLERFAPNSKLDTAEEEKRKARAIRFSQALPKVSGQDNSDLKATTVAQT